MLYSSGRPHDDATILKFDNVRAHSGNISGGEVDSIYGDVS